MSKKISDNLKEAKQSDAAERWKRVNLDQKVMEGLSATMMFGMRLK